jgi:RNA exonuclease NGL2
LMEFTFYKPDIITVQELNHYDTFWKKEMEKHGYHSVFMTSPQSNMGHGCAIFYKHGFESLDHKMIDFNIMKNEDRELAKNNVAILLKLKRDDKVYLVATTHLYWNPTCSYIRFRQLCHLFDDFKKHDNCHIIFAGDLNLSPQTVLYPFITGKQLDNDTLHVLAEIKKDPDLDQSERVEKVKKLLAEEYPTLHSCYAQLTGEPEYTTVDEMFTGTLDYILISKELKCVNVVTVPHSHPIPNELYSSDHFCIYSEVVHE